MQENHFSLTRYLDLLALVYLLDFYSYQILSPCIFSVDLKKVASDLKIAAEQYQKRVMDVNKHEWVYIFHHNVSQFFSREPSTDHFWMRKAGKKQPPEVFIKIGVLQNFAKYTGVRPAVLLKQRLWLAQVFIVDLFFTEHLRVTASDQGSSI